MGRLRAGLLAIALAASTVACHSLQADPLVTPSSQWTMRGHVSFDVRTTQATLGEIANGATVSLIDAASGNTIASSVTDAGGNFVLTFSGFTPHASTPYYLEAVKGLSMAGSQNRAGANAARLRTLLFWNNGWQSLTNSTPGVGIVVSAATTALCAVTSLKGTPTTTLGQLVNSLNTTTGAFVDGSAGLSNANDFQPVLTLVANALVLDQDPLAEIALDPGTGAYTLETGIPVVTSITPAIGTPGGNLVLRGAYLDRINGRNAFWFGTVTASTWSVSADRTQATVSIPASAFSAPLTLQQPNGVVQMLSPFYVLHGTVGTLAGNGAPAYADGTGSSAEFNAPSGLVRDGAGNFYVSDSQNNLIRKITPTGVVSTLAGSGVAGYADGATSSAKFNQPAGLAIDVSGNLYVAEYAGNRVRKVTPQGVVSTVAGSGATGNADGQGTAASFFGPGGIALDATGDLWVADHFNQTIREIAPSGLVSTPIGSPSVSGYADGVGNVAVFNKPIAVAIDNAGNLYIADSLNNRIRKVSLSTLAVTTLAGSGSPGSLDGTGTGAQFSNPGNLTLDAAGNVYVSDAGNNLVRKITPGGVVTTFAGNHVNGFSDGSLAGSEFSNPQGLFYDVNGFLDIVDSSNNRLRILAP